MFGALSHGWALTARGRGQPGYRLLPSVHEIRWPHRRSRVNIIRAGERSTGHAHPLAIEAVPGGIAVIGRVVHAYHAALASNSARAAARLLDFLFLSRSSCYAHAGTVKAILSRIALVMRVVHTRHANRTFDDAGPAAGQLFLPAAGGLRLCSGLVVIVSLHALLCTNGPIQAHGQTSTYDEKCQ